jgi:CelD/BcsL family acetyltransferase involved in cellulose biosynthesis
MQSPYLPRLLAALERVGAKPELVNSQSSPCITLDAADWQACLRQSSSRFRRKLRKCRMSAEAAHEVRLRIIESPAEAAAAMEQLLELHGERWKPQESLFLQPRTRRFHTELVRRWCPLQRAWLHVLEFNRRPAAMDYLFADHGRVWDYQGGWKAELADYSPASLLRVEGIQRAISAGFRDYDLLPGCDYKTHWTKSGRQVADIEAIHPASLKARTFATMRTLKRQLVRSLPKIYPQPA